MGKHATFHMGDLDSVCQAATCLHPRVLSHCSCQLQCCSCCARNLPMLLRASSLRATLPCCTYPPSLSHSTPLFSSLSFPLHSPPSPFVKYLSAPQSEHQTSETQDYHHRNEHRWGMLLWGFTMKGVNGVGRDVGCCWENKLRHVEPVDRIMSLA